MPRDAGGSARMGRDYIPEADNAAADWMRAFANGLQSAPEAYAISLADAANVGAAVQDFLAALQISSQEITRTKVTVRVKHEKRAAAQQLCRVFAAQIKHNRGIDDALKIAVGVPPLRVSRSPRLVPASSPLLNITGATKGVHHLRYHDTSTPNSRALPFGATQLQLFVAIGKKPAHGESEARLCGCVTKNPVRVKHDSADAGRVATYFARWVSQRGHFGPWSLPASMTIAA
jgi:hypothetical protein